MPRRVPGGAMQQPVLRRGEEPWKGQMVFLLYLGTSSVTDVTPNRQSQTSLTRLDDKEGG